MGHQLSCLRGTSLQVDLLSDLCHSAAGHWDTEEASQQQQQPPKRETWQSDGSSRHFIGIMDPQSAQSRSGQFSAVHLHEQTSYD